MQNSIVIPALTAGNLTAVSFPIRSIRKNHNGGYTVTLIAPTGGRLFGRGVTQWLALQAAERIAANYTGSQVERGWLA